MHSMMRVAARVATTHMARKVSVLPCAASSLRFFRPAFASSSMRFAPRPSVAASQKGADVKEAKAKEDVEEDEDENEDVDEDEDEEGYDEDMDDHDDTGSMVQAPQVTRDAPFWSATALVNGEFKTLSLDDYDGKWLVLFFYPLDFTFVCPTEIRQFSDRIQEFEKIGASVVGCSVDSEHSHLAWTRMAKEEGGLGPMNIPLLSDMTKEISRKYGVLLSDQGISLRGLFIIDPQGVLRQSTVNDLPIGRSVDETLRLVQALQFADVNGEVCPAGWKPGQEAMTADSEGLKKYFGKKKE